MSSDLSGTFFGKFEIGVGVLCLQKKENALEGLLHCRAPDACICSRRVQMAFCLLPCNVLPEPGSPGCHFHTDVKTQCSLYLHCVSSELDGWYCLTLVLVECWMPCRCRFSFTFTEVVSFPFANCYHLVIVEIFLKGTEYYLPLSSHAKCVQRKSLKMAP